jgi:hypothetical protein
MLQTQVTRSLGNFQWRREAPRGIWRVCGAREMHKPQGTTPSATIGSGGVCVYVYGAIGVYVIELIWCRFHYRATV